MMKYPSSYKPSNKKELAKMIGINYSTLFIWEKNRPELYKLILDGLKFRDLRNTIREIVDL